MSKLIVFVLCAIALGTLFAVGYFGGGYKIEFYSLAAKGELLAAIQKLNLAAFVAACGWAVMSVLFMIVVFLYFSGSDVSQK